MPQTEWMPTEYSTDWEGRLAPGSRVKMNCPNPKYSGRKGTVTGGAVSIWAGTHWRAQHEPVLKCTYGTSCDLLVDNEGPLIRYDDQAVDDETLHWWPGQAMELSKRSPLKLYR